jgi:hypothetical protein
MDANSVLKTIAVEASAAEHPLMLTSYSGAIPTYFGYSVVLTLGSSIEARQKHVKNTDALYKRVRNRSTVHFIG